MFTAVVPVSTNLDNVYSSVSYTPYRSACVRLDLRRRGPGREETATYRGVKNQFV